MDYRAVVLAAGVLGGASAALTPACSNPDPGAINFAERPGAGSGETQGSSSSSGTAPGKGHPIFGLTTMTYVDPGIIANTASAEHPNQKVEGEDCVKAGCHLDKGPQWLFGGTVYSAAQGGTTVAKAEVRMVDAAGNEIAHTYTDKNGCFWIEKAGPIPAGARMGVRKEGGTTPMTMSTTLNPTDKSCNTATSNCHGTATTGKVFVP